MTMMYRIGVVVVVASCLTGFTLALQPKTCMDGVCAVCPSECDDIQVGRLMQETVQNSSFDWVNDACVCLGCDDQPCQRADNETVRSALDSLAQVTKEGVESALNATTEKVPGALETAKQATSDGLETAYNATKEALEDAKEKVPGALETAYNSTKEGLETAVNATKEGLEAAKKKTEEGIEAASQAVSDTLENVFG